MRRVLLKTQLEIHIRTYRYITEYPPDMYIHIIASTEARARLLK